MSRLLAVLLFGLLIALPAYAQRVDQLPALHATQRRTTPAPTMVPATATPPTAPAMAQQPPMPPVPLHDRIIAVVNDDVISTADVNDRLRLAFISSGLPDTPEIEQKLVPQILRGLIDEKLELQEAKRLDITVSKDEVDRAVGKIGKDNGISGDIRTYIRQHGGSPAALEQQLKAGLAWNKVIARELRPKVEIGDDEVDAALARIKANAGKQEYLVSEIFLAVDNPKDQDQVKQVADNLVEQIKHGAGFGAVAHQFSQGTGAANGGDIGWIQAGQLSPELNKALVALEPGKLSDPIRTSSGFDILGLREKRTISLHGDSEKPLPPPAPTPAPGEATGKDTVSLQQAFLPMTAVPTHDAQLAEAAKLRSGISDCKNLESQLTAKFPAWHWQDLGDATADKLPAWLGDKVRDLPAGKSSEPIATAKGTLVVFMCGRHSNESKVAAAEKPPEAPKPADTAATERETIMNGIGTERLELQARRLLRDLRRSAYLDIRLNVGAPPPGG